MGSPLKRPGDLARLATQLDTRTMDYDAIARTVDSSIDRFDRRQKSFREERRQQKLDQARDYRLGMLKAEQQKGLMIDSNSGYSSIDDYFRQAGRGLADEASTLVSQLSNNEITSDQFAQRYSTISSQVDQLKPFASGLQTMMTNYRTDLANGTLSAANQDMYENLYEAISQDKGNLFLDDNGVLVYQGETAEDADGNTEPFSIPINQLAAVPQPIKKVDPFPALTKTIADTMSVPKEKFVDGKTIIVSPNANLFDGDFSSGVRGAFDDFVKVQGNNGLKSLAMDHLGYDMEQMQAMLDSGPYTPTADDFSEEDKEIGLEQMAEERFSSQLEFEMEKEFIKTAAAQTRDNELQSKLQAERDFKEEQLQLERQKMLNTQARATGGGGGRGTLTERQMASRQKLLQADLSALGFGTEKIPDFSDSSVITNLNQDTGDNVNFEFKDGKLFAIGQNKEGQDREEPINNMYDFLFYYGVGHGVSPAELLDMGFSKNKLRQIPITYAKKQENKEKPNRSNFQKFARSLMKFPEGRLN